MRKRSFGKNKILSGKGESLAETLVSVLVIALALLLLASMVMASKNLIEKSESTFTKNYVTKNMAEKGNISSDGSTDTITISGNLQDRVTTSSTDNQENAPVSGSSFSYSLNHYETVNAVKTDTGIYTYEPVK